MHLSNKPKSNKRQYRYSKIDDLNADFPLRGLAACRSLLSYLFERIAGNADSMRRFPKGSAAST